MIEIEKSWKKILTDATTGESWKYLTKKISLLYIKKHIYPEPKNIFRAFNKCPFNKLQVVILGQDPYHTEGLANGLAFSVNNETKAPPSLKNIFKEITNDTKKEYRKNNDLECWAKQGVLLLNSILTVEKNKPASHRQIGWETFTNDVIKTISEKKENIVFILWGNYAKSKKGLVDRKKHFILESTHPSPFSANKGFLGCRHFTKTNKYLKERGKKEIDWNC